MVWEEYRQVADGDGTHVEMYNISDTDEETVESRHLYLKYEEWCDWYSNDLWYMWTNLKMYTREASLEPFVANTAEYNDFCEFMYKFSSGYSTL
jgi:hypothetical protein